MNMQINGILLTIVVSLVIVYDVVASDAVDRERETIIRKRIFCNYVGCHSRKRSQPDAAAEDGLMNKGGFLKDSLVNLQDGPSRKALFDARWPAADEFSNASDDNDYVAQRQADTHHISQQKLVKIASILQALEESLRHRHHSLKRRQIALEDMQ